MYLYYSIITIPVLVDVSNYTKCGWDMRSSDGRSRDMRVKRLRNAVLKR